MGINKKYILCGAKYRINAFSDPYQNYVATGLNTGNLFIGYAVNKPFKTNNTFNIWKVLAKKKLPK